MSQETTPNRPRKRINYFENVTVDPRDIQEAPVVKDKEILDPSLTKNEIKRIIRADGYWNNTPTEDDGVYPRKVEFPLGKKIGLTIIVILISVILLFVAKGLT